MMGGGWGEGVGCTRSCQQCSWERGSQFFFLTNRASMIYPSCPIGIACARKNCFKNLPCLWFYDKVSNGVFQSGRWLSEQREDERVSWTFYCAIKPENIKIRTQSNMSLLILIKAIHVCYMINPRFTKLVGSRWLGVMPVLFCLAFFLAPFLPFHAPWLRPSHKNAKKRKKLWQCPATLSSLLANHTYILSYFKDSNNVVQAFSSLRAFTPIKFRLSCTKIMHTNEIDSAPKLIWKTF